jgi:hypothetical protein
MRLNSWVFTACLLVAFARPASAEVVDKALKTPILSYDDAQQRVLVFLKTVPGLPKSINVLPATGEILWPGSSPSDNIKAEVWTVVPQNDPKAHPLMMFAVRPDTGEVMAMYFQSLEKHPRYKK